jgi:hypothetical protein
MLEILEILYAIELLEYHDKNHLAHDNKKRSEEKQKLLSRAISLAKAL